MGLLRGSVVFVAGALLLATFVAMNLFLTLTLSLDYNLVQPQVSTVVKNVSQELNFSRIIDEGYSSMVDYCQNNSDFVFSDKESGMTFVVSCSSVAQGKDQVINEAVNSFLKDSYYKEYSCSFWSCFKQENPTFLVSKFAHDYWRSKFYSTFIIILILVLIIFLFSDSKLNIFTTPGILLIISALPFTKSDIIASFLNSFVSAFVGTFSDQPITNSLMLKIFTIFLSQSYNIFLIMISIGVVLTGVGFGLKIWKFEEKFFSKKEEPEKENDQDSNKKKK